jgi:hypothetical protein
VPQSASMAGGGMGNAMAQAATKAGHTSLVLGEANLDKDPAGARQAIL